MTPILWEFILYTFILSCFSNITLNINKKHAKQEISKETHPILRP